MTYKNDIFGPHTSEMTKASTNLWGTYQQRIFQRTSMEKIASKSDLWIHLTQFISETKRARSNLVDKQAGNFVKNPQNRNEIKKNSVDSFFAICLLIVMAAILDQRSFQLKFLRSRS